MRLLIDTNVILDYLLSRQDFSEQAKQVLELARYSTDFEFLSSSAVTDIFYHARKELKDSFEAQDRISDLIRFISVLNVTEQDIRTALKLRWKDFEDAVQYAVALANHVDAIITRNVRDFERTDIPVLTPGEFLSE